MAQRLRRSLFLPWLVVSLLWIAGVAYVSFQGWPAMSLDLSAGDPQVRAAYDRAIAAHVLRYALLAIGPPLVLLAIGWLAGGRRAR